MPRPKLPEDKKKVRLNITVDKKIADEANATGNASEWVNEVCKKYLASIKTKKRG